MRSDESLDIEEIDRERVYSGFRSVDIIRYREAGRGEARVVRREIMAARDAIAVVAWDAKLERLVLIHQFRIAAHDATGRGMEVEVVAGLIEGPNGDIGDEEETVRAELREEAGVETLRTVRLLETLSSPGMTDERVVYWFAEVDASTMVERAGLDEETEETFPFLATLEDALLAIDEGRVANAIVVIALLLFARRFEELTA